MRRGDDTAGPISLRPSHARRHFTWRSDVVGSRSGRSDDSRETAGPRNSGSGVSPMRSKDANRNDGAWLDGASCCLPAGNLPGTSDMSHALATSATINPNRNAGRIKRSIALRHRESKTRTTPTSRRGSRFFFRKSRNLRVCGEASHQMRSRHSCRWLLAIRRTCRDSSASELPRERSVTPETNYRRPPTAARWRNSNGASTFLFMAVLPSPCFVSFWLRRVPTRPTVPSSPRSRTE